MTQPTLDEALATGRLSRMGYVLKCMQLAEENAERIIRATPEAQAARLRLQAEDQRAALPNVTGRRPNWQDN